MEERIMTLHPAGKLGVNISKLKYEVIRMAILDAIESRGELPFLDLAAAVTQRLEADFEGSIGWYVTTVKLDLEARGLIERIPGQGPQVLRLTKT